MQRGARRFARDNPTGRSVAPRDSQVSITSDERLYLRSRWVLTASLLVLVILDRQFVAAGEMISMYVFLLGVLAAGDVVLTFIAQRYGDEAVCRAMLWVLLPDLVAMSGFTFLFVGLEDVFYTVAVLIPVMYALVVNRRQAMIVGVATAIAYVVGRTLGAPFTPATVIAFALKTLAIPLIGWTVATSVETQRHREADVARAVAEKDEINERLEQRLSELQAVSQVTEIVHSTLDFDRVGPMVLSILAKVIGVESCCLFVIDKDKSETLFSASVGLGESQETIDVRDLDDHFMCMTVFDHSNTMVLFCASHDDVNRLTEEDRLVLSAVASELVVAVENSRLYKLTKRLAVTDELTGLANYRHLQTRLDEEIERARRYDKRFSLLMIDTDDFKLFNDAHGHIAGDMALADLAGVLRASVREVDLVARYGGEEFSIALPETDAEGAFVVAEKVREAVAAFDFKDGDGAACCRLTVSIGLATFPTHAWDRESVLREADDALYNAKSSGKNRVRPPARHTASQFTEWGDGSGEPPDDRDDEWTGAHTP
jgi:diguanylate cyclase (GGDEF)-like protein